MGDRSGLLLRVTTLRRGGFALVIVLRGRCGGAVRASPCARWGRCRPKRHATPRSGPRTGAPAPGTHPEPCTPHPGGGLRTGPGSSGHRRCPSTSRPRRRGGTARTSTGRPRPPKADAPGASREQYAGTRRRHGCGHAVPGAAGRLFGAVIHGEAIGQAGDRQNRITRCCGAASSKFSSSAFARGPRDRTSRAGPGSRRPRR